MSAIKCHAAKFRADNVVKRCSTLYISSMATRRQNLPMNPSLQLKYKTINQLTDHLPHSRLAKFICRILEARYKLFVRAWEYFSHHLMADTFLEAFAETRMAESTSPVAIFHTLN